MMPPTDRPKNQTNWVGPSPSSVPNHSGADSTYRNMPLKGTPLASTSSMKRGLRSSSA